MKISLIALTWLVLVPFGSVALRAQEIPRDPLQQAAEAFELKEPARALAELDRYLAEHPGAPAVLDLLRAHRADLKLAALDDLRAADEALSDRNDPASARAALIEAARAIRSLPPTFRLLALLDFDDFAFVHLEDSALAKLRGQWLLDPAPAQRRLAAEWMRLSPPFDDALAARSLIVRALVDASDSVRIASATSLGSFEDPSLVAPLVRALRHGEPLVREHAIAALGYSGYELAVPALFSALLAPAAPSLAPASGRGSGGPGAYVQIGRQSAYVQDFDVEVATGAAIADPVIGVLSEGVVLGARVLATRTERRSVTLRVSIERLIGRSIGDSPEQWNSYWDQNRARFEGELQQAAAPPYQPIPGPRPTDG